MGKVRVRRWCGAAVACVALGAAASTAEAAVPAWTTYRHDGARSGIDPDSGSPVAPSQVWQTPALDGSIYGQPLVYGSRVYVATENDTVYALDAATGAVVWQKHLATPVDAGALPCGDIDPTVGITSTPVIDPATGRIYVVADTWDGSDPNSIAHEMYGLNLSDGSVAVGPVNVDPPGAPVDDIPANQLQRAALALDAGKVIIGYGGNAGDCNTYYGWLVAEPEGGGAAQAFQADSQSGDDGGAIWASGNAPAIDSSGNVWIATGNGQSGSTFDFGESVIKLDPNVSVLDWWAPSDWQTLDTNDTDIGSSMPVLLPGGLVFEIGKGGLGYLLNAGSLGRAVGSPVYSHSVCSGSWGGAIYDQGVVYVTCSDGIHALQLDTAGRRFTTLASWSVDGAVGPPIEAGGLIWVADYQGSSLYGLDPSTGHETFSVNLNGFEHFETPSAAGGRLFVANQDASLPGDDVTAFRIANTPAPSQTTTAVSSSANPATPGRSITLTATVAPVPDAGTVAFSDGTAPIPGCGVVAVSPATGRASCTTALTSSGSHAVGAAYSGDAYYLASRGSLVQNVGVPNGGPGTLSQPVVSRLHVTVVHGKLRLSLVVSEPARLTVVVSKLVPGRRVRGHCRAAAGQGRRCTVPVRKLTLRRSGRRGTNRWQPRMHGLAPGRYRITVTALSAAGKRSKPRTVVILVPRG